MNKMMACRARCKRAVLAEQARKDQDPSERLRWEHIALASLAETRMAVLRAIKLGTSLSSHDHDDERRGIVSYSLSQGAPMGAR